jgi:hypothetical protein
MEQLVKRLTNLLTIKSLVTLSTTVVFTVLSLRGEISSSEFLAVFTTVVGFYFGSQAKKEDPTV